MTAPELSVHSEPHYLRSWLSLLVLILLDRGWSRAPQQHTGEDDKDIRITIRQIVEGRR